MSLFSGERHGSDHYQDRFRNRDETGNYSRDERGTYHHSDSRAVQDRSSRAQRYPYVEPQYSGI